MPTSEVIPTPSVSRAGPWQTSAHTSRPDFDAGGSAALLPLLIAMPLMYWPRVVEGDTQPWVVLGATIAFISYWPRRRDYELQSALTASVLAVLGIAAYWLRGPDTDYLLRYAGILATFVMLWYVAGRRPGAVIGKVVRFTIAAWFVVGVYQTVAVRLGLPIEIFGRYEPGRSGVPSLTAEASYFGSISVLQLMYLLGERDRRNTKWIWVAVVNVILSGSLLSFLLLAVPLFRLRAGYKVAGAVLALVVVTAGLDLAQTGFFSRIENFNFSGFGIDLLADASVNLRVGHIWFTLFEHLPREMLFQDSVNFHIEYNGWARFTGIFINNSSDFILPFGGDLMFRSGLFGLAIISFVTWSAYRTGRSRYERWEKFVFVCVCLLNPISLANPFFIFYIRQRPDGQ